MKKLVFMLSCLMLISCNSGNQKESAEQTDASTIYVYYFHGKQRCKTCIAVENITKQAVTDQYRDNNNVKYVEVKTDEKENEQLVEKYQIVWNALIIAKGNEHVDITDDAFATAVNSPEVLTEQIKTIVNTFLK